MKKSIKLIALFLIACAGAFVTNTGNGQAPKNSGKEDVIIFAPLPAKTGILIRVKKAGPGTATVIIYDSDNTVLRKDVLYSAKMMEKGYVLDQLENGDYNVEVTSGKQVVKKGIHVYDENKTKTFIIKS